MKVIVTVDEATGAVLSSYGPVDDSVTLPAQVGILRIDAPADGTVYDHTKRWNLQKGELETAPVPVNTRRSRLAFRELFTSLERKTVRDLVKAGDDDVTDAWEAMQLAEYIDLADLRVAGYLTLLVGKGVLTVERRAAILAGEAPK